MQRFFSGFFSAAILAVCGALLPAQALAQKPTTATILPPSSLTKIAPATVFFRGQSAPFQLRNTFGVRMADGAIVLMGLVDSSGYSTGIQQKYQGYILTESPLHFANTVLPAGAYGFGFIAANKFTVMDLGNHDLLQASWAEDAALARPRPLQILATAHPGSYRLYSGKKYVEFTIGK